MTHRSAAAAQADQHLTGSFDAFYRSTRPRIFRAIALALGDSDLALDATDEAMTRAAEQWREVGGFDNPAGWVYRVALNWARSRLRRLTRERGRLDYEPGYDQAVPDPHLMDRVMSLPLNYRAVIVARFLLDWSVEETAEVLQALLVPIFLMGRPQPLDVEPPNPLGATTVPAPSIAAEPTVVPTTSAPPTTAVTNEVAALGSTSTEEYLYTVAAEKTGDGEMPTANVTLTATGAGGSSSEAAVGEESSFFWRSVTGEGGLCLLSATSAGGAESVGVQVLLSPSLGCSEPYFFSLTGEELAPKDAEHEDVARLFFDAWLQGADPAIAVLATPEAANQAAAMTPNGQPTFSSCEGAAGSLYCTWEAAGPVYLVRVSSVEPIPMMTEFTTP
ncbi:MAG TPA: RNA polymerase sigma factor [Acidimicrobiia bacterium]|nr:RNA polymerase sigma factor [Acidimicrobiia bacterium]